MLLLEKGFICLNFSNWNFVLRKTWVSMFLLSPPPSSNTLFILFNVYRPVLFPTKSLLALTLRNTVKLCFNKNFGGGEHVPLAYAPEYLRTLTEPEPIERAVRSVKSLALLRSWFEFKIIVTYASNL